MTTVLLFLFLIWSVSIWWLSKQRLASKPWLESGHELTVKQVDGAQFLKPKVGLIVLLAIIGMFFALLISANFMRQELHDWRQVPLPNITWLNTELLIMSSLSLQFSLVIARRNRDSSFPQAGAEVTKRTSTRYIKIGLGLACFTSLGFLVGQLMAWAELSNSGFNLTGNPANSFFYMLTGIHGLHILGGLVVLGRTIQGAWVEMPREQFLQRVNLCAIYWHFLLLIWVALLIVMLGWAHDPFISAHH